ncbi:MAG: single-stranded DNA-binding protein [Candidatus Woesebacteria bacterium]
MSVRSLNKVMLIGNLTRDPNLRYTPSNTAVCSFGLATNRSWTPSDGGERQERVDFHNIVAWSKLAEICGQLLHKGDKVYVEGRIQTRDWKTEAGEDRRVTEIVIDNMMLLSSSRSRAGYQADDTADDSVADDVVDDSAADDSTASDDDTSSKKGQKKTKKKKVEEEDIADDIPF